MNKTIPLYQVDSFATEVFTGNPAAVCPTDEWLSVEVMQKLAMENNLSETAYVVPDKSGVADFGLRWFTPKLEMDLCGHATLASAWVLFNELNVEKDSITFSTQVSGILTVSRGNDGLLTMDFPVYAPRPAPHHKMLEQALGGPALEYLTAPNGMKLAVLGSVAAVTNLKPNLNAVAQMEGHGLIVTAKGEGEYDFVSRFFAPLGGIAEDPVTGSAHTVLAPYWAKRLKKETFHARQVSKRGGDVHCVLDGERVKISGHGVLYMKGQAHLPG
ncbi:MAG: PhzF family phenazine biosynthesis protein [Magnetovibrio sp.]|nr:PhzF family phenazine biosynthesis protein [Magnetovibrio sp.]